ncbi:MAG: hypothetical protein ACK5OS_06430 [Chryseotalea sp.]|jgi:hypothetical protein
MRLLAISLLWLSTLKLAYSQGCSDAGFCTMGAMKPDQPYNKKAQIRLRAMEISLYRGTTNMTPIIYVANADFSFSINNKYSFQVKLPYQMVSGRLANTASLGDISISATRNLVSNDDYDINFSVGAKIPTNNSNLTENGRPLPMYYQTSLGTYDAIAGVSLLTRKWLFATGIQIPLNKNKNEFLWGRWADSGEDMDYIEKYARANNLNRGIDVMLRIERNFRFSQFNFSLGLLPIYRIKKDEVRLSDGSIFKSNDAQGLAASVIGTMGYNINIHHGLRLLIGHKIEQRKINADGLSRELVSSIAYIYRF